MNKNDFACASEVERWSFTYVKCDCCMFLVCHTKHIVIVARTEYPVLNVTDFGYATHVWTLSLDKVVNKGDLRQMNTCDCIWILKHPQILTMSSHPNL